MKVGEYIRTPKGIGRINQMYSDRKDSYIYLDCGITIDYITKDFTEEEINKMYPSSPNIIDLIEVGDYVNGKKVIDTYTDYIFDYTEEFKVIRFSETDIIHDRKHIETIVTKEQFSCMEYKIGE